MIYWFLGLVNYKYLTLFTDRPIKFEGLNCKNHKNKILAGKI
jgi:hypothetical protein